MTSRKKYNIAGNITIGLEEIRSGFAKTFPQKNTEAVKRVI